jgi:bifunctional non-homologous end joining protein LigD
MAKRPASPASALKAYRAKRDFTKSPEPAGAAKPARRKKPAARPAKGRRFCVQKHLASHLHYDFRLEHGGVLLSWAVPKGPSLNPADKRLAMRVEDHPVEYGSFEGVIPEGYGAGVVMLWDEGTWSPEPGFEDVDRALEEGELKLRLEGTKLKGSWVLVRTRGGRYARNGEDDGRTWLLIKHRDDWAGPVDVTKVAPLSVKSFGDFADILASGTPDVWQSHRPAQGGAAGKLLSKVIAQAAALREKPKSKPKRKAKARG